MVSDGNLNWRVCDLKKSLTESAAISYKRALRCSGSAGREETISFSETDFPLRTYDASLWVMIIIIIKMRLVVVAF